MAEEHFIVLCPSALVSNDLAEAIGAARGGAVVHVFSQSNEVEDFVGTWYQDAGDRVLRLAFLSLAPESAELSGMAERLAELGVIVVLMGDGAEESRADTPYRILHRPFSEAALSDLLRVLDAGHGRGRMAAPY